MKEVQGSKASECRQKHDGESVEINTEGVSGKNIRETSYAIAFGKTWAKGREPKDYRIAHATRLQWVHLQETKRLIGSGSASTIVVSSLKEITRARKKQQSRCKSILRHFCSQYKV